MDATGETKPWGYRWRSAKSFILMTAVVGLFSETFLYAFPVPILSHMIEERLHLDPSQTQRFTTSLLSIHGFVSLASAPIIAHYGDKTPNRKIPFLVAIAGSLLGTFGVACTAAVWLLYVGRVVQAVSGSAAWITSFTTLVDNIDAKSKGRVLATAMSFATLGIVAGPMVSGMFFQLLGYWSAWSVPIALLVLDFVARLLMIETRPATKEHSKPKSTDPEETAGLLQSEQEGYQSFRSESQETKTPPSHGFYRVLLTSPRAIAALTNTLMLSAILAGFDATLPLFLRNTFGWDSLRVGMIFLGLQGPPILLGPCIGWVRDRVGPRWPTTLGWALLLPLLWLHAAPDCKAFGWARPENHGQAAFLCGLIGIGFCILLVRGAGTFQLIVVTNELQAENPNIFGPYGGNSKISSVTEIAFNSGMMVGPLFSGLLREKVGYYYMNCLLGMICLGIAVSVFVFFTEKPVPGKKEHIQEHN